MDTRRKYNRRATVGPCVTFAPAQSRQSQSGSTDATDIARKSVSELRERLASLRNLTQSELAEITKR